MRLTIRAIMVVALLGIGVLLSGHGVLVGSHENAAGLGVQCQYITSKGMSTAQYLNADRGIISLTNCPLVRKNSGFMDLG